MDASVPMQSRSRRVLVCGLLCTPLAGWSASRKTLSVADAQVREPRPGFGSTVAFMALKSAVDVDIVAATTPVAQAVRLHRVVREGSLVQVVTVPAISLAAGRATRLQPGEGAGHLMLRGLLRPLRAGERVPLALSLRDAAGRTTLHHLQLRVVAHGGGHAEGDGDMH